MVEELNQGQLIWWFCIYMYLQSWNLYRVIYKLLQIVAILSNWTEEVIDNQEAHPLSYAHNKLLKYAN